MRRTSALPLPVFLALLAGLPACRPGPRPPPWPPKSSDPNDVPFRLVMPPEACQHRSGAWSEPRPLPSWSPETKDVAALNDIFSCPQGTAWRVDPARDRWVVVNYTTGQSIDHVRYTDGRAAIEVAYPTEPSCEGGPPSGTTAAVILLDRSAAPDALPVQIRTRTGKDCDATAGK